MRWFWEAPHDCVVHGHKFEARFDYEPPNRIAHFKGSGLDEDDLVRIIRAQGRETYVKDVCVHCGLSVDREHTGEAVELIKVVG